MNLDIEIEALTNNILAEPGVAYVTRRQVGGICGLLKQGLSDPSKDNQIKVLRILVGPAMRKLSGVEITSRRNLTSRVASHLIDLLVVPKSHPWKLTDYGRTLLQNAENRAKASLS